MKLILCMLCLVLSSGCALVPKKVVPFPAPPEKLMVAPPEVLKETPPGTSLSESVKIIVDNYTTYHLTKEQLKSLQSWIRDQEKLYK